MTCEMKTSKCKMALLSGRISHLVRSNSLRPLWTVAHQPPLSLEFSRQEYWNGQPFPSPRDLPDPGIEPRFLALQADCLLSEPPEKPTGWLEVQFSSVAQSCPTLCDPMNRRTPGFREVQFSISNNILKHFAFGLGCVERPSSCLLFP